MNVLPLLTTDLVELLRAAASGRLGEVDADFARRATVCKYVVPEGYPEGAAGSDPISVDASTLGPALRCYWAAAELGNDAKVRLTGSRGLAFVGIGDTVTEAEALAERGASSVGGAVRHRSDIGTAALLQRRVDHMRQLRRDVADEAR
jgi:phosphoribosylamine--glycine ligase